MKKLLIAFVFFPLLAFSQIDEEAEVNQIREWYKVIESNLSQCVEIELRDFYDEEYITGGSSEITGYYDTVTNEIIKVVEHNYYDWAEDVSTYYFHDGQLFFLFSRGSNPDEWYTAEELEISDEELWEKGGEVKTFNFYEERFYFKGERCIRRLYKAKKGVSVDDADLKTVYNEKADKDDPDIPLIQKHGIKIREAIKR